ncbi:UDP-N-acetylglucosamine--undecaprenyl-phosphate N-acetylglucosaminephosphotransferase [Methylophaga thalassica]|uniref:UDP-N-acetylglucosamine--undecaprenyl-phosphate N-acetylglucosaminephosphotransferase n=1 Tax=Methylophaga aminisulfidivorans TaxID=230105 RepID=UPI003A934C2B
MKVILVIMCVLVMCTLALLYLRRLAIKVSFVDVPNGRKSHNGHVPVIGGLSTLLGIWLVHLFMPDLLQYQSEYMCLATLLVTVGLIDDKLDISATSRLVVLGILSVWLVYVEHISLSYLGNLFGYGDVYLGNWSIIITMAAVIGCITAFNMVDGIDGLLGSLASISLFGIGILFLYAGNVQVSTFCLMFTVAMLPYVFFNLGLKVKSNYKVFMGDSGSFLVGFTVIWLLVFSTQEVDSSVPVMNPVTSLWMIAVPLMDMVLVMLRRLVRRKSPFNADRTHIHHILQEYGFTPKQVLLRVSALSIVMVLAGLIFEVINLDENISFYLFLTSFVFYAIFIRSIEFRMRYKSIGGFRDSAL